ncbi:hypothetical protein BDDG_13094 [Blastomyces dermatitidis ATCC 18188]|uniref:Uncharacterized protein n=1 Tax=Ajellomyces dermatitidis (strain ATCC 18188 / CBS 674.68) TaxID=653446 RepID=A0A0J9HI77_AJEDA|nr:hypothetical protein BDDG_13094 [Blastomyces dermatitidis ATCC 18188]
MTRVFIIYLLRFAPQIITCKHSKYARRKKMDEWTRKRIPLRIFTCSWTISKTFYPILTHTFTSPLNSTGSGNTKCFNSSPPYFTFSSKFVI